MRSLILIKEEKQKLSQIEEQRKVYLDEAGFDNREDYGYGYSPKGETIAIRFDL